MGVTGREAIRNLPRFHVLPEQMTGGRVNLEREQARKAIQVLRLKTGDLLGVMDGSGDCFRCRIVWTEHDNVSAEVLDRYLLDTEPPQPITLCQALPKGDKLDQIVRGCTEAGASRFVLFPSEHSIPRWPSAKIESRLERLRAIGQEEAEVALRARVPAIQWAASFTEMLALTERATLLYEGHDPLERLTPEAGCTLIVGPEGGFSDNEVREAVAGGCRLASLGPRVLRAENAGLFAIAQLLAGA